MATWKTEVDFFRDHADNILPGAGVAWVTETRIYLFFDKSRTCMCGEAPISYAITICATNGESTEYAERVFMCTKCIEYLRLFVSYFVRQLSGNEVILCRCPKCNQKDCTCAMKITNLGRTRGETEKKTEAAEGLVNLTE
jgi:hypothetical protein